MPAAAMRCACQAVRGGGPQQGGQPMQLQRLDFATRKPLRSFELFHLPKSRPAQQRFVQRIERVLDEKGKQCPPGFAAVRRRRPRPQRTT